MTYARAIWFAHVSVFRSGGTSLPYDRRSMYSRGGGQVTEPVATTRGRSLLATLALAVTAISVLGIIIIFIGLLFDIEGAREGDEDVLIFNISWLSFFFGAIASLILGAAALVVGRRRAEPDTGRAGTIAVGWFVIALVIFVLSAVFIN